MEVAPTAMKAAAPIAEQAVQSAFLPAFITGVVAVLLLGFIVTLALRWWNNRQQ